MEVSEDLGPEVSEDLGEFACGFGMLAAFR